MSRTIAGRAEWLKDGVLQKLLAVLSEDGDKARIAGGAVRNALLGEPVTDIDIATTTLPDETMKRARAAGFKPVPTGYEHGTITVVAEGRPYEVTTLRSDVETFGRRARVAFGRDWKKDAERRDFTINALYAEPDGAVVDLVGGFADIAQRRLRFIGDVEQRIREDYLRILRFFRFFAWYGEGRPDADGLKACARLKEGLLRLSAQRVWAELKKLFAAPDPSRALLWMRQAGVLSVVLPESDRWGVDAVHGLVRAERDLGWPPDPLLRLEAIVPPDPARMTALAKRLRLSRAEADRLARWAMAPAAAHAASAAELSSTLYYGDVIAVRDRLRLACAGAREAAAQNTDKLAEAAGFQRQLGFLEGWRKPRFPLKGGDLLALNAGTGKEVGKLLGKLETEWVRSGFAMSRGALMKRAAEELGR